MISQRTLSCLSVLSSDRDRSGKQLRSLGGGDLDLNVVARPGRGLLDPNDPVRVDAFPEAAALGGAGLVDALDQHVKPAADPGGLQLGQYALLQLLDPLHAGAGGAGGHAPIEVERGGAVLGRIREEGDPIQAGRFEERFELADVGLALAGEPQDEVGAEGRVAVQRSDPLDQPEEGGGGAPAAHPAQYGLADVLEREVEVGAHHRVGGHLLEQAGRDLVRLEIVEPHPAKADQQLAPAEVLAVAGGVLRDQADLRDAMTGEPRHLVQNLGRPPRAEAAAEGRDGAERAVTVTSLSQLDQSDRSRGYRPRREGLPGRRGEHHRKRPAPSRDQRSRGAARRDEREGTTRRWSGWLATVGRRGGGCDGGGAGPGPQGRTVGKA